MEQIVDLTTKLTEVDARARSNSHRIGDLESRQEAITELALSVREMATEQNTMKDDIAEVKADVKSLTLKPGSKWDSLVDKAVWLVVGGLLSYFLTQIGL